MACTGKSTNCAENGREAEIKINQWERRKAGTEILVRLSKQYLELVSVVKEASKKSAFSFLFIKAA
jgi:hypothetical protein